MSCRVERVVDFSGKNRGGLDELPIAPSIERLLEAFGLVVDSVLLTVESNEYYGGPNLLTTG